MKNFSRIRDMAKAGVIYQTATENAAHLLAEKNELKQAYGMLLTLGKKVTPAGLNLLHQLAYSQCKWDEVVALGDRAYHNHPSYQVAVINAAAHAALGNIKPAIGWIQSAIHDGIPHLQQVLAKREFDTIRSDPQFRSFLEDSKLQ